VREGLTCYTLLYIKIDSKDLVYSTGNSTQNTAMTCMRKESNKECIYVYISPIHFAIQQQVTQHCKAATMCAG